MNKHLLPIAAPTLLFANTLYASSHTTSEQLLTSSQANDPYYIFSLLAIVSIITLWIGSIVMMRRQTKRAIKKGELTDRRFSETIAEQQKLINQLNLSLTAGKLYRWDYNLTSGHSVVTTYCGEVHQLDKQSINYVRKEDKIKLLRYIQTIASGQEPLTDIEIWVQSLYHQENRLYRVSAILEQQERATGLNIHGIWKDITEENRLNNRLSNLQKKIMMALEVGEMSTWEYNCQQQQFTMIDGNSINQDKKEGISRDYFLARIHPDDREEIVETLNKVEKQELTKSTHHFRFNSAKGSRNYLTSFVPIFENNQLKSVMGVRRNITREVNYQEELEKRINEIKLQNNRLELILESLPIPILIRNVKTKLYTYANKAAMVQYGAETGVTSIYKILSSRKEKESEFIQQHGSYEALEIIQTKEGRLLDTVVSKKMIRYNNEEQLLISRTDLTESLKAKRFLSTLMPALKAYSWHFDSRFDHLNIEHNMHLERDIKGSIPYKEFIKVVHPEDRASFLERLQHILQEPSPQTSSFQFRLDIEKKGEYEWWESNLAIESLSEEKKPYKLASGLTVNINDRKKGELELARVNKYNELILNNSHSLLAYVTTDYKTIWSNAESALSGEYKQMYGTPNTICYEAKGEKKPCQLCPISKALATQSVSEYEFLSEKGIWYKSTTIRVPDTEGVPKGVILRLDDVTEYKKLIADLEVSRSKAEESDRLKSVFLANMSHEIRTPLNAIVGYSELLQETENEEEKREYIGYINSNNQLLLHLIGDILDYSKIEAGTIELNLTTFDYAHYMEDLFVKQQKLYNKPGVKLIAHNPYHKCIVTVDQSKCTQIAMNFLTNALKYTDQGEIRFGYEYRQGGLILFTKDTGIGVAADKQEMLFRRFEKGGSFLQGAGLGLSIVKGITEHMGGKVGVKSKLGEGSLFWAWIPCEANLELKSPPQSILFPTIPRLETVALPNS
ncbi:MAG: histidine kinase dimerization/phospho-acceptor domain-containing protein [Phocaeicola sp.]